MTDRHLAAYVFACALVSACMPYTTGRTAATVPVSKFDFSLSGYAVTPGVVVDSIWKSPVVGFDIEARYGLNERSDIGIRVMGISGGLVSYKRQLQQRRPAVARIVSAEFGGGIDAFGESGILQGTLMTSTREILRISPYGGTKTFVTVPLSSDPQRFTNRFTIGAFLGARFKGGILSVTPEVGGFYSPMPELRKRKFVFVPSLTISGLPNPPRRGWPFPVPRPKRAEAATP